MAYPTNIDQFIEKLNKKDGKIYVVEEVVNVTDGKYEGELQHDNVNRNTIKVYTGSKLTGNEVKNIIVSGLDETPWKTVVKIFSQDSPLFITYETQGDQVEAEDINKLQDSMIATQIEVDRYKSVNDTTVTNINNRLTTTEVRKANKVYVDTWFNKKADKANVYTKTETDERIQLVINAAPSALDTLKEISDALNNDPDFAATMTVELSKKVDKVKGKGLSTEDYTTGEKNKLTGVEDNANRYIHPSTHPASMIVQNGTHRMVSDSDKSKWNNKETPTGAQTKADNAKKDSKDYTDLHVADNIKHITAGERNNWNDANNKKHVHSNKNIIDTITQSLIIKWNNAVAHIADTVKHITASERSKWNSKADGDHFHTKDDIGLGNVDNTADINKPISTAVQNALNNKADNHSHPYLPSSGGIITGKVTLADGAVLVFKDSNGEGMAMESNGENWRLFEPEDGNKTWLEFKDDDGLYVFGVKVSLISHNHNTIYEPKNSNIQTHINSAHAPANAQKNSYITKAEIEAKLKGTITTHSHNPHHTHVNKNVLDKLLMSGSESSFDLSHFVTNDELGNAGYGDMLKSIYDTNNNGKVDNAENADSVSWSGIKGKPSTYPPSSHEHSYLPLSGGSITGNLSIGTNKHIKIGYYYINRYFTHIENKNTQYWILCENAQNNDVIGYIQGDRTSGNWQQARVDIYISSSASEGMKAGFINTNQVMQNNEVYELVTFLYNNVSYIGIKYSGNAYPFTDGAYFIGYMKTTKKANELKALADNQVTNIAPFTNNGTKTMFGAKKIIIKGSFEGLTWNQLKGV